MTLKVEAGTLKTTVQLPASKSHANRYLILAARRGEGTIVQGLPQSQDVQLLLKALRQIGLTITGERDATFHNSFPECEKPLDEKIILEVGEGGTTARFLAAMLSLGKRSYVLRTSGRLALRPWSELTEALQSAGVNVAWIGPDLIIQGPANIKALPKEISAARSTQFASALRLAFAPEGYHVTPTLLSSSKPYWDMTEECVKAIQMGSVTVPLDWSSAAYPAVFAAVVGPTVSLPGLYPDGQADRALYELLWSRGSASVTQAGVEFRRLVKREAFQMSVLGCPDLVPALAFLAAHLEGVSELSGVDVLRHKESDRLTAILALLNQCGVKAEHDEKEDVLKITGGVQPGRWDLHVPSDHRLVMTAALFLRAHRGGTVTHPDAVQKSFPHFFDMFNREGA